LSYIEGWHAISEANRVFGFDAWDRQTIMCKCVWEGLKNNRSACSYIARVRIRVRAGDAAICREGSGSGHGTGRTIGEAHENALKEAETDAMKRALTTFGNPFGLALYDKEQRGVRHQRSRKTRRPLIWAVFDETRKKYSEHDDPIDFCSGVREYLEKIKDPNKLKAFWACNFDAIAMLQKQLPDLKTPKGQHYSKVLGNLYASRIIEFAAEKSAQKTKREEGTDPGVMEKIEPQPAPIHSQSQGSVADAGVIQPRPRRIRDRDHLRYVASHECLICDRFPTQAHHVRFAQPRAMGRKVSDEWTVPLCATHHREVHAFGNEEAWWELKKLDPLQAAGEFWQISLNKRKAS